MVRAPHSQARRRDALRPATLLLAAVAAALLLACAAAPVQAQSGTIYWLTIKRGTQAPAPAEEDLFDKLEEDHGPVQESREVPVRGFELDLYSVSPGGYGLGLGLEAHTYGKTFNFDDPEGDLPPERVRLQGEAALLTIKGMLRLGRFQPFVGAGIGNYYVNYKQKNVPGGFSLRDAAEQVYTARVGTRLVLGRLGLLYEVGQTHAPVSFDTPSGKGRLQLGGSYVNVGISWLIP